MLFNIHSSTGGLATVKATHPFLTLHYRNKETPFKLFSEIVNMFTIFIHG